MPRLSDDEDIQLFDDDGPTQRRGLVAYRVRVDEAEPQNLNRRRSRRLFRFCGRTTDLQQYRPMDECRKVAAAYS